MDDQETVSPYLRRPLRSLGEVLADRAAKSARDAAKIEAAKGARRAPAAKDGFPGNRLRLVWDRDRAARG